MKITVSCSPTFTIIPPAVVHFVCDTLYCTVGGAETHLSAALVRFPIVYVNTQRCIVWDHTLYIIRPLNYSNTDSVKCTP